MRDHEPALIEHVMANEAIQEFCGLATEIGGFRSKLLERFRKAVADFDVATFERPRKLHVVVARDTNGGLCFYGCANKSNDVRRLRSAVDKVAKKDRLPTVRMAEAVSRFPGANRVAQLAK